jgi:hypothetical protein
MIGTTAIRRPAQRAVLLDVGTGPACVVLEDFGTDKHEGGDPRDLEDSKSGGCSDP